MKSYPVYAGVQDALMQWWYGHNAVAFFLTTPFLGLMYYFLPKAAERPGLLLQALDHPLLVARLHLHLGRPAPPALHGAARVGLDAGHGLLGHALDALLGRDDQRPAHPPRRVAQGGSDPILKFFVVGVTFYGMSTFEGPMLSIKAVNSLSHYTDWTIAHVHSGALGWNGFMTFGMLYWLMPRLFQTKLWSQASSPTHFWIGTDRHPALHPRDLHRRHHPGPHVARVRRVGRLAYPDFVETVTVRLIPMYWLRMVGGTLYIVGASSACTTSSCTWRPPRSGTTSPSTRPRR